MPTCKAVHVLHRGYPGLCTERTGWVMHTKVRCVSGVMNARHSARVRAHRQQELCGCNTEQWARANPKAACTRKPCSRAYVRLRASVRMCVRVYACVCVCVRVYACVQCAYV